MALTQAQLNSLYGVNDMTPNQSAQALGSSNGMMSKIIGGAEDFLPTAGAIAGGIGGAALGGLAGLETGPGAIATAYAGGVAGSGAGAAAGEALKEKLQGQQLQPGEIAKQGAINAAFDAVGGPLLSAGGKLLEGVAKPVISTIGKGVSKIGEMFGGKPVADVITGNTVKATTAKVASTAETMTLAERKSAIAQGRQVPTLTGGGKYVASDTEKRAGTILKGKLSSNPVKNVPIIQKEISSRGQEAVTYLEKNAKPITNAEDYTMFQQKAIESEKYMTPAAQKAYQEQIGVFQKVLKDFGENNTANYYKALKDFESNVTENLPKGKQVLFDEGGSARIQAAKDVRSIVRDMIGQKNPEFKGKMFDIASLYDALDNTLSKAEQVGTFAKRFPKTTTIAKGAIPVGLGVLGVEEGKNLLGL